MEGLSVLAIIGVLFGVAALLSVWFSLWAWIVGPAVRHLARCAAEGWAVGLNRVRDQAAALPAARPLGINVREVSPAMPEGGLTGQPARTIQTPAPAAAKDGTAVVPAAPQKFTITGRPIR
jgi:hypothetical protein